MLTDPPEIDDGYPRSIPTSNGFDIEMGINRPSVLFYVTTENGELTPTVKQVMFGMLLLVSSFRPQISSWIRSR